MKSCMKSGGGSRKLELSQEQLDLSTGENQNCAGENSCTFHAVGQSRPFLP